MLRGMWMSLILLAGCGEILSDLPVSPVESLALEFQGSPALGAIIDESSVPVRFDEGFATKAAMKGGADLSHLQTPVKNQGGMGACTGFAIASLREAMFGDRQTPPLSPLYIFQRERQIDKTLDEKHGVDRGSHIRTGMQVLKNEGIPPESFHPYLTGLAAFDKGALLNLLFTLPERQAASVARDFRVNRVIPMDTFRDFRYHLSTGHSVVFAFRVFSNIRQTGPDGWVPKPDGKLVGGHAVLAVGFNDARQEILFKNSWGPGWGDRGYGRLPYDYVRKGLVWDAWTAI